MRSFGCSQHRTTLAVGLQTMQAEDAGIPYVGPEEMVPVLCACMLTAGPRPISADTRHLAPTVRHLFAMQESEKGTFVAAVHRPLPCHELASSCLLVRTNLIRILVHSWIFRGSYPSMVRRSPSRSFRLQMGCVY
jgi:hypothetical protein